MNGNRPRYIAEIVVFFLFFIFPIDRYIYRSIYPYLYLSRLIGVGRSGKANDREQNTGEIIEFKVQTEELLVMHNTWTQPGQRTFEHIHPEMEERFEVIEGQAAFRINGEERKTEKGEVVVAPQGMPHLAWNPTNAPVQIRIEMRPALRWAEFVTRLCAGEDPAALLREFSREVVLVNPQEANFTPTAG